MLCARRIPFPCSISLKFPVSNEPDVKNLFVSKYESDYGYNVELLKLKFS